MSAVMMTRINARKIRVPVKVAAVLAHPVLKAVVVLIVRGNPHSLLASVAANVTTTVVNAAVMPLRGVPFPEHRVMMLRQNRITAGSAARVLSIQKCCVVSALKKLVYMAKTPVRPCS
ncbi:hypothetical protein HMPREF0880_04790 [Yokenella regensburgei ATCC 43003]|nr:hypothetical protein HMPREF0880_04790 [Yokenella regensburgei ATCC 43003]